MKIIAELCQNHNGNEKLLNKMVEEAAINGASHVKIQHIYSRNLSFRPIFENGLIIKKKTISIKRPYKNEYNRLKKLEISHKSIKNFIKICKKFNVVPLTTCFAREHVNELSKLGFEEIKVASYDCASYQLLKELKKKFKHIYVSTGATYNYEIINAAKILKNNFSLLHCVTEYPTDLKNLNLSRLKFLKKLTNNVGYSDHTAPRSVGISPTLLAIYLGSKVIERHFTILNEKDTRDGIVSIYPKELKLIKEFSLKSKIEQLKIIKHLNSNYQVMNGNINKKMSDLEKLNRDYYRGRFCSYVHDKRGKLKIFNWEETPLKI